jgi:4'-phosphopantetheinyl transferase
LHRLPLQVTERARRQLAACLSGDEQDAARRFRFERDRQNFTVQRALLRQVLGDYLGLEPSAVRFAVNTYGKPQIPHDLNRGDLRFSYSHSADWALLGVTRGRELGVDVEQRRPMSDAGQMASSFFAASEVAALEKLPPAEMEAAFFACWTRKEAFLKALGQGLSFPLNAFAVSLDEPARLLELRGAPPAPDAWVLRSLDFGAGFAAALAMAGPDAEVRWQTERQR